MKGDGKSRGERAAEPRYSLLAYFGCFYFSSSVLGISSPALTEWQQAPRLPRLILTATAEAVAHQDAAEEGAEQQRKEESCH